MYRLILEKYFISIFDVSIFKCLLIQLTHIFVFIFGDEISTWFIKFSIKLTSKHILIYIWHFLEINKIEFDVFWWLLNILYSFQIKMKETFAFISILYLLIQIWICVFFWSFSFSSLYIPHFDFWNKLICNGLSQNNTRSQLS